MIVIGIVGGIASGKSLVTSILRQFGAQVIDADRLGHAALADGQVKRALRRRWGDRVFLPASESGESDDTRVIDRKAVAEIVFAPGGDAERQFLEEVTHPLIRTAARAELNRYGAEDAPAVILDAALLLEANWDRLCDVVLFIDADSEQRLQRARARGWSEAQWRQREASQLPLEQKRRRSDYIIHNSGTPEETEKQLRDFWLRHVQAQESRVEESPTG